MSLFDKIKVMGKGVVDAGAKQMLKVRGPWPNLFSRLIMSNLSFCLSSLNSIQSSVAPFCLSVPSSSQSIVGLRLVNSSRSFSSSHPQFSLLPPTMTCGKIKVDITLLDREIKTRKQEFGIQIYDLMEELESNDALSVEEKEAKIRAAFDAARKDIAVIRAKKDCKQEEISLLEVQAGGGNASTDYNIPPSSGAVITNEHPADASLS